MPPEKRRREKAKTTAAAERILRKHGFGRKPDKARKKMTMDDAFDANTKRVKSKKTQGVRTQNKMTAAKATAANKRRRGGPSTDR